MEYSNLANRRGCKMSLATNLIKISKMLFIWPEEKVNFKYIFIVIFAAIFNHQILFGMYCFVINYLNNNDYNFSDLADAFMGLGAGTLGYYFMLAMIIKRPRLLQLIEEVGDFTVLEIPKGIEKLNDRINLLVEASATWMIISVIISVGYNLTIDCEDNVVSDCGLIIISYLPFLNLFETPHRQIFLIIQALNALHMVMSSLYPACVMLVVPIFMVNRLDHLKDMLKEIPTMKLKKRKAHIKKCVAYHHKIIEYSDRLEDISFEFMMIFIGGVTLIATLIMYQLLVVFKYINFAFLLVWLAYLYLICLVGETLLQNSIQLADVIYESIPWDGDLDTQKALLLMMLRAQKPLYIPGGMSGYCCHELLSETMKTCYSIIAMLMEM